MTTETMALSVYRWPRPVTLIGLAIAATVATVTAVNYAGPLPTAPTCDGKTMTHGDECAEVPAGTDTSGYSNVLGGKSFNEMLAQQQAEHLDWRWGSAVVAGLVLLLVAVLAYRVITSRLTAKPPAATGQASWHAQPISASLGAIIGALLFGTLATNMARSAGQEGFLVPDLAIPLQWILSSLLAAAGLYLYAFNFPKRGRVVRADDAGLTFPRGTGWESIAWSEITEISDMTSWPVVLTTTHGIRTLSPDLSDRETLSMRLQAAYKSS